MFLIKIGDFSMKLKEYLEVTKMSGRDFSERSGIGYGTIVNILLGLDVKLSTALKIEDFTHGVVKYKDLTPIATRVPRPRRLERKSVAQIPVSYEHQQSEHQENNEPTSA
jgi:predicted transcriptional regulator